MPRWGNAYLTTYWWLVTHRKSFLTRIVVQIKVNILMYLIPLISFRFHLRRRFMIEVKNTEHLCYKNKWIRCSFRTWPQFKLIIVVLGVVGQDTGLCGGEADGDSVESKNVIRKSGQLNCSNVVQPLSWDQRQRY